MKLALLGFDGFDSQLFEGTDLAALAALRGSAQWGTLWSETQETGPCWATILTGWSVESHGVTHLLGLPYGGSEWFGGRPKDYIFDELGHAGLTVGVANFPGLYFAREVNGWTIGGWPGRPNVWPRGYSRLLERLYSDLPDYEERGLVPRRPAGACRDWSIHEMPWEEYMEWARGNAELRLDIVRELPQVDALMMQESVLDRAGHMLSTPAKGGLGADDPRYAEALALADRMVARVTEEFRPEFLCVCSDHGFEGAAEADASKGCWHSPRGLWALRGPNVWAARNDMEQTNFAPTVLDALGVQVKRDGHSALLRESEMAAVEGRLRALGY